MVVDRTYRRSFKFRHFMSAGLLTSHDLQTLVLDITNTARTNECMAYPPHVYFDWTNIIDTDRITLQSLCLAHVELCTRSPTRSLGAFFNPRS
jgi:hypothetical protein